MTLSGGPAETLADAVNGDSLDDCTCTCAGCSSTSLATATDNPIESFVSSTSWTREDLQVALTALSISVSILAIYLTVRK